MIHKYKLNGFNIVLDVNSGGVHLVDDMTYDLLDLIQPPFFADSLRLALLIVLICFIFLPSIGMCGTPPQNSF